MTTILSLCGSLRAASLNAMLLRVAARLAPPGIAVIAGPSLGTLPLFNPDLEAGDPPAVAALRSRILATDALLIASPEYAHGVSGVMKNALDWMVGNESFIDRPVALLNASPRASIAQAALRETLATMSARIVDAACVAVPLLGGGYSEESLIADARLAALLVSALRALADAAAR